MPTPRSLRQPAAPPLLASLLLLTSTVAAFAQSDYDHSNLTQYRDDSGVLQPVRTVAEWDKRRDDVLAGMQQAMGPLPSPRPAPEFDVQITERMRGNGFERLTVTFAVENGDRLPADLYLPMSRREDERRPAMLALHPTGAQGKRIVAGAKPNRQYARELAERGYVVLAPDYPSFGQLADYDFAADSYVSGTMKGIVNHMRCVDFLISRPEVDADRIGVIGHSLGGHNALFVAAFDKRLKVAVTSCGWTPFHYYYGGKVKGWTSDRYMPLIRDKYQLNADLIPFDFYEVIAAIAPRAVYSASPLRDSNFTVTGIKHAEPRIRSVFARYEAADRFRVEYPACAHDFPTDVRARTYAFVDSVLEFDPVAAPNFAGELPRIPPTDPEDALKRFTIHPEFEVQLAAREPQIADPVAACFDAWGRLYVVEMRGYSEDREMGLGRVRRLEDRDGDGFYERSTLYADGLKWPTAIAPYRNGVFVAAAPHIYYLNDGFLGPQDGRADRTRNDSGAAGDYPIVLTGLKHTNVQGLVNCMRWSLDGRIHVATSSSGADLTRPGRDDKPLTLRGRDFSFDPRITDRALSVARRDDERASWDDDQWTEFEAELADRIGRQGFNEADSKEYARESVAKTRQDVRARSDELIFSRPRFPALRPETGGGQHGMCFDDYGRKFVCQNSNHIQIVRYEDRYSARAAGVAAPATRRSIAVDGPQAEVYRTSPVEPWRLVRTRLRVSGLVRGPVEGGGRAAGYFTGATGTTIYRGDAWPDEFRGQAFAGDVGSNIVHRKTLVRDGREFRANRARENVEFIASTDNWFRPVQFMHGPDGNLYVLDMYRETIEHPASLPPQIKRHVDLTSGRDRGRIYRIVHKSNTRAKFVHPAAVRTAKLVGWLDRGNSWERETAARLLFEKQSAVTVEPLRELLRKGRTAVGRLHALYSLHNVRNALTEQDLIHALGDPDAGVREHAVRLAESRLKKSIELAGKVASLATDPEIRVRSQVAFSAHALDEKDARTVIAAILRRDASDEVTRFAATASAKGQAAAILAELGTDQAFQGSAGGRTAIAALASLAVREGQIEPVLTLADTLGKQSGTLADTLLETAASGIRSGASPELRNRLAGVVKTARTTLRNPAATATTRITACRRLKLLRDPGDIDLLIELLVPTEPQALQLAAVDTLSGYATASVAQGLIGVYENSTPTVQSAIVAVLVSRDVWAESLLDSIRADTLPAHAVTVGQLNTLTNSRSAKVRGLAGEVRKALGTTARADVVAAWQDVLSMKGTMAAGREVFRKNCAKCHRLEGVGEEIGAGLASIRNRGAEAVLLNILDPNREVNPQYNSFLVVTEDGRSVSGVITNETASGITLRDGEKTNATIPRDEIAELRNTGLSLMPEGLEKQLSKQQMADLLQYLMTVEN